MNKITLDGIEYSRDDIKGMRNSCIGWRNEAMNQWPDAIPFTVGMSHVIGVLSGVLEQYPE